MWGRYRIASRVFTHVLRANYSVQAQSPPPPPPSTPTKVKVYTKTGDKGTSSLFNGERRSKADEVFCVLGDTDELNAHIGVAAEHSRIANNGLAPLLEEIQSNLLDIGSHIATPRDTSPQPHLDRTKFSEEHVGVLEKWIDELEEDLPPLRNFILPGGGLAASTLHVSRAVCRRAERALVSLSLHQVIDPSVSIYLNRLSDFLFVSARYAAKKEYKPEIIYGKSRADRKAKKELESKKEQEKREQEKKEEEEKGVEV